MPARAIGTATISFGLVSVPVNLYSSSESKANISFNMLHKKCGTRLKQQYICPKDSEIVTRDQTVKGYEISKDHYVVLTPEELKALEEKATETIDINEFVPLAKVDREFVEKTYYLGPDKGGDRAYRLLAAALDETGRAALGQYAARGQQHLVLLRPLNGVIVMEQLHYADELRPTTEVDVPEGTVKPAELSLAKQLIEQSASDDFVPEKYKDTVRERQLEAIEAKIQGQEITEEAPAERGGKIIDLMEALKQSLSEAKASSKEEDEEEGEHKTRKTRRAKSA
jgi:DNA end-binding protein Ku